MLLVVFACGDDGSTDAGTDANFDAGEPPDTGRACATDDECPECQRCAGGGCVPRDDGLTCEGGVCNRGRCCRGCLDDGFCSQGDLFNQCGVGGVACTVCTQCDDACPAGACVPVRRVLVASVSDHACVVADDGALFCWGVNEVGQLGDGTETDRVGPRRIRPRVELPWVHVGAGAEHTCAITSDGTMWCWGQDTEGQLGTGIPGGQASSPLPLATTARFASVDAGKDHTCAIGTDDGLYCWGDNGLGQLGDPSAPRALEPTRIGVERWQSVSTGARHTCGVLADGRLFCWGDATSGKLGLGARLEPALEPREVAPELGVGWSAVSAGDNHTCAVTALGELHCWGRGAGGALGVGDEDDRDLPERVGTEADWVAVSAGPVSTCGARADGSLWCWGRNVEAVLGAGDTEPRVELAPARILPDERWAGAAVGAAGCAVREDGAIFCWGPGPTHGAGTSVDRPRPTRICIQ